MPADPSEPELPEGLDLAALLAPVPGEAPAGVDLREANPPAFVSLGLARNDARDAERRFDAGDPEVEAGSAGTHWRSVAAFARKLLAENSKDLDVAAALTDAMVRLHGLPGLTAGAMLLQGLCEAYWDELFPRAAVEYGEEPVPERVRPIAGLNGTGTDGSLMAPLRRLQLFPRPDGAPFAWWEYERSRELAGITDENRREQRLNAGAIPIEDVEKEARAAGPRHFAAMRRRLKDAAAAWAAMSAKLDELAGMDSPSTGRVRDLLAEMLAFVARFAPPEDEGAPAAESAVEEEAAAVETGGAGAPAVARPAGTAGRSREDVLRDLVAIAEYFRKTEPNSPLSYTLEDAVRRARLTWPELLEELVEDESARAAILNALGIRRPPG